MSKIIDINGKKLEKKAFAMAAVYISTDGETWGIMPPKQVPDWVQLPEAMGDMMAGEIIAAEEEGPYYRVRVLH